MVPIEFLRQFRIYGYAIFDFLAAYLGIYLLAPLLSKLFLKIGIIIPKRNWLYLTLPIGVISHLLTGKITPLTRDFIDLNSHYVLKILFLIMIIFGLKGIKFVKKKQF